MDKMCWDNLRLARSHSGRDIVAARRFAFFRATPNTGCIRGHSPHEQCSVFAPGKKFGFKICAWAPIQNLDRPPGFRAQTKEAPGARQHATTWSSTGQRSSPQSRICPLTTSRELCSFVEESAFSPASQRDTNSTWKCYAFGFNDAKKPTSRIKSRHASLPVGFPGGRLQSHVRRENLGRHSMAHARNRSKSEGQLSRIPRALRGYRKRLLPASRSPIPHVVTEATVVLFLNKGWYGSAVQTFFAERAHLRGECWTASSRRAVTELRVQLIVQEGRYDGCFRRNGSML